MSEQPRGASEPAKHVLRSVEEIARYARANGLPEVDYLLTDLLVALHRADKRPTARILPFVRPALAERT